jgi:murein DD-endopeptidase MepM/ murein hydrolase activator NlpD
MVQRSYGLHPGADIGVPGNAPGTPIYAIDGGRVVYAGWGQSPGFGNYGNVVAITHTGGQLAGLTTVYAHLESINRNVRVGSDIGGGALLGGMGDTGYSDGVHLHFEVRRQWNRRPTSREEAIDAVPLYNANKWIVGGAATTATPEPATPPRISEAEATNEVIRSLLGINPDQYRMPSLAGQFAASPPNQPSVNGTGGNGFRNYWNVSFG